MQYLNKVFLVKNWSLNERWSIWFWYERGRKPMVGCFCSFSLQFVLMICLLFNGWYKQAFRKAHRYTIANTASGLQYNLWCFKPFFLIELKRSHVTLMHASFLMRTITEPTAVRADISGITAQIVELTTSGKHKVFKQ